MVVLSFGASSPIGATYPEGERIESHFRDRPLYCSLRTGASSPRARVRHMDTTATLTYRGDQMIQGIRRSSRGATSSAVARSTPELSRAVTYVVRGEVLFLFFTAVSVALHPGFVIARDEGGMSNYGLHLKTAVPYTLALALLVLYSARAASIYEGGNQRTRRLRQLILAYSAVVFSILLSTYFYSLNEALTDIHFSLGTALIAVVGVGSIWMYQLWPATSATRTLLALQLSGDVLALLTVVGTLHLLFLTEILSNVAFATLLIQTCRRVAAEDGDGAFSSHQDN